MDREDGIWQLRLAEIGPLRAELNSAIDRININEMFCLGFMASTYAYIFNDKVDGFDFLLSIVVVLVLLFGMRRYWELRYHIEKLDKYLINNEKFVGGAEGGWTEYYCKSVDGSKTGGHSFTRWIAWCLATLIAVCISNYSYYLWVGY